MRILVDILHPAHVHFFKHSIWEWQRQGHTVLITSRDKDVALNLLDEYGFEHKVLSTAGKGLLRILWELVTRSITLIRVAHLFKADLMVGVAGSWIAPTGKLLGVPTIVFYGTEVAKLNNLYAYPLATAVCTPVSYQGMAGKNHVRYRGNHELAYLHPERFVPDSNVLHSVGLSEQAPFILVRTVAWTSHHDVGEKGFRNLPDVIHSLEKFARVVISSEGHLHPDLESNRLSIPPHLIHHVVAGARLYIGESSTMASESAVLGVPAIFISSTRRGFMDELEQRYGLAFTFSNMITAQDQALDKALELLSTPNIKEQWEAKRQIMLDDCVDVTQWILEFIATKYDLTKNMNHKEEDKLASGIE